MRVLSLFDGCGMAYQALKNLGIKVEKYYSSEIDKWAIKIAKKNHPDIISIGDINNINANDYKDVDLIVAGFPCQSFSIAGKRLNFEDERGQLFFKALEILKIVKPKYFIFENVASMRKDIQSEISRLIGVEPIMINSSLVSAQNRKRLYWTNIEVVIPQDNNIFIKDILEKDVDEKYFFSDKVCNRLDMGNLIKAGVAGYKIKGMERDKATTILARDYKGMQSREFNVVFENGRLRKLTPIEYERLQTLPDDYTSGVSDTQRYKMLGNGFTVAVIEHILKAVI